MLDFGLTELLLIGVVALIVVGPKDLPVMFHALGRIMARARGMAREFSSAMDDAAKASGMDDAAKDLRSLGKLANPRSAGVEALGRAAEKFEKWDPMQPVRDATSAVPDPAAPSPSGDAAAVASAAQPVQPPAATQTAGAVDQPIAGAAGSPRPEPSHPDPAAADGAPQPGSRRLHAVRRSDRS